MLVLSRKQGEKVVIGDVIITIVMIERGKIRLGIEAPGETPIRRAELEPPPPDRLKRQPESKP